MPGSGTSAERAPHLWGGFAQYMYLPWNAVVHHVPKGVSPELKKRMQGKTCFNFASVEEGLFGELAALTRKGFEEFQRRELV